jgi:hypothetical protein
VWKAGSAWDVACGVCVARAGVDHDDFGDSSFEVRSLSVAFGTALPAPHLPFAIPLGSAQLGENRTHLPRRSNIFSAWSLDRIHDYLAGLADCAQSGELVSGSAFKSTNSRLRVIGLS